MTGVTVQGLDRLVRDFQRVDKGLAGEMRRELRGIAGVVAKTARGIAEFHRLRDTGRLIRGIRPAVRGSTAVIRDAVTNRGFPYPALYEREGESGRSFLWPAVKLEQDDTIRRLEDMIDRLAGGGLGRGGRL